MSLVEKSCWEILNISPSCDKKIIKRAYHKLLRDNKPDEKPNEFKIIYEAYQNALKPDINIEEYINTDERILKNSIIIEDEIININYEDKSFLNLETTSDIFYSRVDSITYDNDDIEVFNNLNNWYFIENLGFSDDLQNHTLYAKYLFGAISHSDKKFEQYLLDDKVLEYLNDIFLWTSNWQKYPENSIIFDYFNINSVAQLVTPKYLSLKIKLTSISIDIAISIFISFLFTKTIFMEPVKTSFFFFVFYGLPFIWFRIKTPGQYITKLKVFEEHNYNIMRVSHAGAVIRVFLTIISIFTFLSFFSNPNGISTIFVLLNAYFLYSKRLLIQDLWATKIYVE